MKKLWIVLIVLFSLCLSISGWAEPVPETINYQAYLTDDAGNPLPDGYYEITFRIYNVSTGGDPLWAEVWAGAQSVALSNSRFSVELGSKNAFESSGLNFNEQYYLEIQIGSEAPFSPRLPFTSVPYAMHAKNMNGTPLPDGQVVGTSDAQTLSNKTLSFTAITDSTIDNAIIGATTPAEATFTELSVTGDLTVDGTISGRSVIAGEEKISDYALTDSDDIILVDTFNEPVAVTLPAAVGNAGRTYTVVLKTAGNPLTIIPVGSETINGLPELVLDKASQAVRVASDGFGWQAVGEVGNVSFTRDALDLDDGSGPDTFSDQVILNDMIVQNSECIGLDCEKDEVFDFDTLILKENNLRVHFNDTSSAGSFPTNDWRIVVNDSTEGGRNYFAIEDADAGKNCLVIEAGGDVGIGTNEAPKGKLEVKTSSGKTGLVVTDDGNVGIGTAMPAEKFVVEFEPGVDVEIGRGTADPNVTFIALRSPDGTKYYITVDEAGNLTASANHP